MNTAAKQRSAIWRDTALDNAPCHTASTRHTQTITPADLPLCCPMTDECLWDAHPRIYLPLDENGSALCPYCGTEYVLKNALDD